MAKKRGAPKKYIPIDAFETIYRHVENGLSIRKAAGFVAKEYGVNPETLRTRYRKYLEELRGRDPRALRYQKEYERRLRVEQRNIEEQLHIVRRVEDRARRFFGDDLSTENLQRVVDAAPDDVSKRYWDLERVEDAVTQDLNSGREDLLAGEAADKYETELKEAENAFSALKAAESVLSARRELKRIKKK